MLHDDNRVWVITLQQMPQWRWSVMMRDDYAGDDLEVLRCRVLREVQERCPSASWRPTWFAIRPRV